MAVFEYGKKYIIYDYSTDDLTEIPQAGELRYFDTVITGQVYPVHVMGNGTSKVNELPFVERLEIHASANVDLESLRITGLRVKIYNSSSSSITVQTGVTGSLTYENINAKCSALAFYDGTYWRVEDGFFIGAIQPWHKNFTASALSLPWGWVEMDGSAISDAESPFNGETPEDLVGDARFLRGGATSGTLQADAMQKHTAQLDSTNTYVDANGDITIVTQSGVASTDGFAIRQNSSPSGNNPVVFAGIKEYDGGGTPRTADETRSINMSVVWIMKIK